MFSLKDFINKEYKKNSNSLSNKLVTGISASLASMSSLVLSNSNIDEFSKKVSSVMLNEETITELSDKIGKPKDNETEDEFVIRAKLSLKNILMSKLEVK